MNWKIFERVRGTDEVMQIKEWCKEKGDLKDFRTEFQTFFVHISATIWHLSIRKSVIKKHMHALKKINNNNSSNNLKGAGLVNKLKLK